MHVLDVYAFEATPEAEHDAVPCEEIVAPNSPDVAGLLHGYHPGFRGGMAVRVRGGGGVG
jgi:hypothetical protein